MTMTLIETKTLVSAAASIEFTSIPQDGTDLFVLASLRSDNTPFVSLRFNGSTSNFTNRHLSGEGGPVISFARTDTFVGYIPQPTQTANTFSNTAIYIPNYSGSTNKTFSIDFVTENNATTAFQGLVGGLWSDTAAITSLQLFIFGGPGNFISGSTVSIYSITKGSDGIVTTS